MDWSKAKNILIVAFIIVNLILGYTIYNMNERRVETISDSFVNETVRLLEGKNIHVTTEIPRNMPSIPSLLVVYETRDADSVNNYFFENEGHIRNIEEDIQEVYLDNESVIVSNNKLVNYISNRDEVKYSQLNEEKAIAIAYEFLNENGYAINDLKLNYIRHRDGEYILNFSKIYNDTYVEIAYTNFLINETGVKTMDRMWLNIQSESENPIYLQDAAKSILELLSIESAHGRIIEDISVCYYFNPEQHLEISDPVAARQGKAMPSWRVQFSDGQNIVLGNH